MSVAIVTGASRGIGAATALKLAEAGHDLVINYRTQLDAAQRVAEQVEALGLRAICVQADITKPEQVAALFSEADSLGRLAVLVNNAGVLEQQCQLLEVSLERMQRVFATNVFGAMLCCQQATQRMSTSKGGAGGVIVNVSSAAARLGAANEYIDYAASKGALDTLTIGLANELAEQGIRVNGVRPGLIYTEMHASGGEAGRVDRLQSKLPLQRGGRPEEVANAIAFLASDASSYSTGAFLDVSGGR